MCSILVVLPGGFATRGSRRRIRQSHGHRPQRESRRVGRAALRPVSPRRQSKPLPLFPTRRWQRNVLRRPLGVHAHRQLRIGLAGRGSSRASCRRLCATHDPLGANLARAADAARTVQTAAARCGIPGSISAGSTDAPGKTRHTSNPNSIEHNCNVFMDSNFVRQRWSRWFDVVDIAHCGSSRLPSRGDPAKDEQHAIAV